MGAANISIKSHFYVDPGHSPEALEETEIVEVSPSRELRVVGEHMLRQLAAPM